MDHVYHVVWYDDVAGRPRREIVKVEDLTRPKTIPLSQQAVEYLAKQDVGLLPDLDVVAIEQTSDGKIRNSVWYRTGQATPPPVYATPLHRTNGGRTSSERSLVSGGTSTQTTPGTQSCEVGGCGCG